MGPLPIRSTDSGSRWPKAVPKSAPAARLTRSGITRDRRLGLKVSATLPTKANPATKATLANV